MQECSASPISHGASVPAADLPESSRAARAPALPDQRSSTDFNPVTFPCNPRRHWEGLLPPHGRWMHPGAPLLVLGLGLCCLGRQLPPPGHGRFPDHWDTAGSLKIREKPLPLSPPGGAGNSLWSVHSSGVHVKTCSAGSARASSHSRFADGCIPAGE